MKKNKDGLHSYCKACVLKKAKESMLKNYDKQLERMRERNLLPGMKKAKKKYNSSLKKKKTQQIWQEKNKLKTTVYKEMLIRNITLQMYSGKSAKTILTTSVLIAG